MTERLTEKQRAMLEVLRSCRMAGNRGYHGLDCRELAKRLDTSPEGAAMTASALVRKGLAVRFVGGIGRQRVHFQAAEA